MHIPKPRIKVKQRKCSFKGMLSQFSSNGSQNAFHTELATLMKSGFDKPIITKKNRFLSECVSRKSFRKADCQRLLLNPFRHGYTMER